MGEREKFDRRPNKLSADSTLVGVANSPRKGI